jgi:hemolysin activation/secretion protein
MPPFVLPAVPITNNNALPDESKRVIIRQIDVRGNTVLADTELTALTSPFLGRSTSLAELETLRQNLTRLYTERGYVNSGVVAPREIVDGIVHFDVAEGHLSTIRLRGMERLVDSFVQSRLRSRHGEVFNVDRLRDRFQVLLADPLFASMNARILPGERAGEAILDIDVARARPYQLSSFINNYRPVSIGENTIGITGSVSNLSGRGDVLDASVQRSLGSGHGARGTLGWRMPLNAVSAFTALLDRGSSSVIEEPTKVLDIRSRLASTDLGVSHTVLESLSKKWTFGLSYVDRENRTSLLGEPYSFTPGEPSGRTHERFWRLSSDYSLRSTTHVLALHMTVIDGHNNLQTIVGLPTFNGPAQRFRLWQGQAQYAGQIMANGAQFIVRTNMQYSSDRLLPLDALAIGGVHSVRGYRENQLVRDRGVTTSIELDYPLLNDATQTTSISLLPFIDYGRVQNVGEDAIAIASVGLASNLKWNGISVELAVARRLLHPPLLGTRGSSLQDSGVHLQLSYKY